MTEDGRVAVAHSQHTRAATALGVEDPGEKAFSPLQGRLLGPCNVSPNCIDGRLRRSSNRPHGPAMFRLGGKGQSGGLDAEVFQPLRGSSQRFVVSQRQAKSAK